MEPRLDRTEAKVLRRKGRLNRRPPMAVDGHVLKVIGMSEALEPGDVVQWTRVTSSFVGHGNSCKS
jgi:hypothetical protein